MTILAHITNYPTIQWMQWYYLVSSTSFFLSYPHLSHLLWTPLFFFLFFVLKCAGELCINA